MSDSSDEGPVAKTCSRCKQVKALTLFSRQAASADGHQAWCRQCMTEWKRLNRQRRREPPPATSPGEKWCRACQRVKPLEAFALQAATSDGRQAYCRSCFALRYRRQREAQGKLSAPIDIPDGHKFCRSCQRVLPLGQWTRRTGSLDGYHSRCRDCAALANRADHLARTYGLTLEDVEAMLHEQSGLCAICQQASAVHVDHDHSTGVVRGMLCFSCNAAIGHLRDDPFRIRKAAVYLETAELRARGLGVLVGQRQSRLEICWAAELSDAAGGGAS